MTKPPYNRRYIIRVSQADIDAATASNSGLCAVNTAIRRAIPGATNILTDVATIRFTLPSAGKRLAFLTPPRVGDYITAFDAGDVIPPFTVTLRDLAWVRPMLKHANHPAPEWTPTEAPDRIVTRLPPLSPQARIRYFGRRIRRENQVPSA